MKKSILIALSALSILNTVVFAQSVASPNMNNPSYLNQESPSMVNPNLLEDVVKKENLIGKILSSDCEKVKPNEICELKLKQIIKVTNVQAYRIIKPKMPVTMDFSPNRVNVTLDKDSKIIHINIG